MPRTTGTYHSTTVAGETVRAFVPFPLPPVDPPLAVDGVLADLHSAALVSLSRLAVAATLVPNTEWFLYGFVRKEAVITSEIEGTQATLQDVVTFETTRHAERPDDVREVCNYVDALTYVRKQIGSSRGLPLSTRLLCEAHKRLMRGTRGSDKLPGEIRLSQNWIGGSRPGNARFVPPPPHDVPEAMSRLEQWIHGDDSLPPLIRAGLAHVQFETIHPFLDGNGRIGRLLVTLLLEHWSLLDSPILYLSHAIRERQQEYYARLIGVRDAGDWEGWTIFFLECVRDAANDGVDAAQRIFALLSRDRQRLIAAAGASIPSIQLLDKLPSHPVVTLQSAVGLLNVSKPTAIKALNALEEVGVLLETTGRKRDRVYAYQAYLDALDSR
jgi:Fic family protein